MNNRRWVVDISGKQKIESRKRGTLPPPCLFTAHHPLFMEMARILIVDDASFMRNSLKYIVETAGHTVVGTAKDGNEAQELYRSLKPDLVTLDILMKGGDGLSALKNIRKEDPKAKVIMITALGQEEKQEEARQLGASGYIRKPFNQTEVITEIQRVLNKKEEEG